MGTMEELHLEELSLRMTQERMDDAPEFRGKTGDRLLRHPSFKGVREDLGD
jgi:hypothetical protein